LTYNRNWNSGGYNGVSLTMSNLRLMVRCLTLVLLCAACLSTAAAQTLGKPIGENSKSPARLTHAERTRILNFAYRNSGRRGAAILEVEILDPVPKPPFVCKVAPLLRLEFRVTKTLLGNWAEKESTLSFIACGLTGLPDPPFHRGERVVLLMCPQKGWCPLADAYHPLAGLWFPGERSDEIEALLKTKRGAMRAAMAR
jgi:hypothetical protein